MTRSKRDKIFYVSGIRHHAIVLAQDADEARRLAVEASKNKKDLRMLFGHIGDWEDFGGGIDAHELKLPSRYSIVKKDK